MVPTHTHTAHAQKVAPHHAQHDVCELEVVADGGQPLRQATIRPHGGTAVKPGCNGAAVASRLARTRENTREHSIRHATPHCGAVGATRAGRVTHRVADEDAVCDVHAATGLDAEGPSRCKSLSHGTAPTPPINTLPNYRCRDQANTPGCP